jgi:hypothetical protein
MPDSIVYSIVMLEKKRSNKEFEAYLKATLDQDYPKVKYQSPDAWRIRASKKKRV